MSKISPCLWFNGEAEEAANLLRFACCRIPGSRRHRNMGIVRSFLRARLAAPRWWIEFTLARPQGILMVR